MIKLLLEPVNFLILDEPTNHLDMRSKDVLKEAIKEFDGTVIVVSHDREFLDGLVDKVYEFGGGKVREHLGGIYDFLQHKNIDSLQQLEKNTTLAQATGTAATPSASAQPSEGKLSYEEQKAQAKALRKLERVVEDAEKLIEKLETELADIEAKMSTPEGAADMQLCAQYGELKNKVDAAVEQWEKASEELEEAKNV